MVLTKIEEDDKMLEKLVLQTVSEVKNTAWLDVEISEKLITVIDYIRDELDKSGGKGRVTVTPKACPKDTCRVNTEEGTIVSTVTVQAENLRNLFHETENKK